MFFLKIKYLVIVAITLISLSIDVTASNDVYSLIKDRLKIPMQNNKRSLNVATSVAIILAESLKQTNLI